MKIGEALPWVVDRQYPIVRPEYSLLTILYLLRMRDTDAVPLTPRGKKSRKAVFGYSSLLKMVDLEPRAFAALLRGPCETASQPLATRGPHDELGSVLEAFAARRLGFALIHSENSSRETGSLVSLADILELYRSGVLSTNLRVGDVSSPVYSVPGETSMRETLMTMLTRRMRRVFIKGERRCISDRDIIYEVFSPVVLDEISGGKDPLAASIGSVKGTVPSLISADDPLSGAAIRLGRQRGECLLTRGDRVVTPWDVVMKPWLAGKLSLR